MAKLSKSDYSYISSTKQYVDCTDCEFLTFEKQCSNRYDYPEVDKNFGCCFGKDRFAKYKKKKKKINIDPGAVSFFAGIAAIAGLGLHEVYVAEGIVSTGFVGGLMLIAVGLITVLGKE